MAADNPDNQKRIRIMLKMAGRKVVLTGNGRLSVETFSDMPYYFDLILMDVQMPKMNGFVVLLVIKGKGYSHRSSPDSPYSQRTREGMHRGGNG